MFIESYINNQNKIESIEVIASSMISGKIEELVRRLRRTKIAKQSVKLLCNSYIGFLKKDQVIILDEKDIYEPLCKRCYRDVNQQ